MRCRMPRTTVEALMMSKQPPVMLDRTEPDPEQAVRTCQICHACIISQSHEGAMPLDLWTE